MRRLSCIVRPVCWCPGICQNDNALLPTFNVISPVALTLPMGWVDQPCIRLPLPANAVMTLISDRVRSPFAMDRSRLSLVAGMQAMESRQSNVRSSQRHSPGPPSAAADDVTTTSVGDSGRLPPPPPGRPAARSAFPPRRRPPEERRRGLDPPPPEGRSAAFRPVAE